MAAAAPSVTSRAWEAEFGPEERRVCFEVVYLGDKQVFVWVGDEEKRMDALHMALVSPLAPEEPCASSLLGPPVQSDSRAVGDSLSRRLASKLKKVVFVSYNLASDEQDGDGILVHFVEKQLIANITR